MKDVVMIIVGIIVVAVLAYFLFLSPNGLMKSGKNLVNSSTNAITELQNELPTTIK